MPGDIDTSAEVVKRHLQKEQNPEAGLIPVPTRLLLCGLSDERDLLRQRAERAEAEVARLREALEPFALTPKNGPNGGPITSAQIFFEDGHDGSRLGKSPTWPGYIPYEWFKRARDALAAREGQGDE